MDIKRMIGLMAVIWLWVLMIKVMMFGWLGVVIWSRGKLRFWGWGGNGLMLGQRDKRQNRLIWMGIDGFDVFYKPKVVILNDDLKERGQKRVRVVSWSMVNQTHQFFGKWQVEKVDSKGGSMRLGKWMIKWEWEGKCEGLRLVWESCEEVYGAKIMFLTEKWGAKFK